MWAGFTPEALARAFAEAGLVPVGEATIPSAYHPAGIDAALTWHAWVAAAPAALLSASPLPPSFNPRSRT